MLLTAGMLSVAALAHSGTSAAPANKPNAPAPKAQITILYDAFGKDPAMKKDWGFSALVEVAGKRILFDTGNDRDTFKHNAKAKGVDFTKLDFVVMSHRHSDHMAGLARVLNVNPDVKIYAPKEGFGIFGSSLPSSFYRKNDSLPPEMRYYDGKPPEVMSFGTAWQGAHFELIDKTTEVAPGIWLIALVSDLPGTRELKELSLPIDTPDGLVLIVGCSHPGIEKIVEAAATINPRISLIVGGFHLVTATDEVIDKVTTALHDTWKVENVAPGHCTGEATFAALRQAFGDHYIYAGLGTVLRVGDIKKKAEIQSPLQWTAWSDSLNEARELRGAAVGLNGEDLETYRRLARTSSDALEPKFINWLKASFSVGKGRQLP